MDQNGLQLQRISHYETLFEEIATALATLKRAENALEALRPAVEELTA